MYPNFFKTRKPVNKQAATKFNINDAWAAVAHADRINEGQYVNDRTFFQPGEVVKHHNKKLAYQALNRQEVISEEDRKAGEVLASHFSGLLFRTISGTNQSNSNQVHFGKSSLSFIDTIANIVAMKEVGTYEVACMACLPNTYRKDLEKEARKEKMFELSAKSNYIGTEGSKQEIEISVIDTFFSQKYNSLIITAACGSNIIKFFSSKEIENFSKGAVIKVRGTIKHTSVNERTGGKETWLTRVKVV